MTLIAGMLSRRKRPLADSACASLRQVISRNPTELLRSIDFPDQILSKRNLRLAACVHSRGWRDYRYAIEAVQTYYAYSKKCGGEFTFSVI